MAQNAASNPEQVARDVLDNLMEGCQVVGFDFRYLFVNDAVARHGGKPKSELLGRTMMECYPGIEKTPMFERLQRCMSGRHHDRMENEFEYPDGSKGWFELRFVPVPEGTCILSLDTTDAKRAAAELERSEAQLRHAQKMEAVGRLAGAVAHDFNNILSVILSYAGMLIADLQPGAAGRAEMQEIEKAGRRAAELTRQLLAFSRQQVVAPRVLDLNARLADMEKMLRRLVGEDVEVRISPGASLGKVKADAGQLEQVLMNLVVNARDAMPDGGTLTIETSNVALDDAFARGHLGVRAGPYVMLAVSDTGVGMDKATQERIFEPFFTTKAQGTGLGLSTVFGIVQQSGGSLWVYSEPGKGSTFKVYLPRVEAREEAPPRAAPAAPAPGTETILLVEDDPQLRAVARTILRRGGYRVLEAANGAEALSLAHGEPGRIDLMVTDLVMPQMNGRELARRLAELRPNARVLFVSGYTDRTVVGQGLLDEGLPYLQKPITPESLLVKVRETIEHPGSARPGPAAPRTA